MQIIGLTGGIASGKSEACRFLSQKCGISVIDTDAIGRKILETDQNCISNVLQVFPNCSACTADGDGEKSIDRVKLASEVFKKPEQRRKLESIIHPIIWSHVVYQLFLNWIKGTQRVIIDVPLLFEGRMHRLCSYTVLIACSTDIQRARLLVRNSKQQTPEAEDVALLRIHAQMKLESKLGLADVVIYNEDGLEDLFIELYSKVHKKSCSFFKHFIMMYLCVLLGSAYIMTWTLLIGLKYLFCVFF